MLKNYFVSGRTSSGELVIFPTQSLEGYRPGSYPPTVTNTVTNDMPWIAGLHSVLPRLLNIAAQLKSTVPSSTIAQWSDLLQHLPALPVEPATQSTETKFAAATYPYAPHADLGGSEQPYMYPVHPYRLATVMNGGDLLKIGTEKWWLT